jgi:3',5'-cyclic AMP phosphodiesterase CpdA
MVAAVIQLALSVPVQASNPSGSIPVNPQVSTSATTTILNPGVVSWVHFGDLHITTGDQQNYADFKTIINNLNQYLKNGVNFALLPGDNANDHTESEYQLIKQATDQLQVPLYAIPGDHDLKGGTTLYNQYLEPVNYQSFTADKYHFVFLDVMSGISDAQKSWLTKDLDTAAKAGLKSVIFMHTYTRASELQDVIQRDNVIVVDTGHTHYNEVANDGHTIYAATRSTGQATEGPVGFSIINLDNGVVSWKFKPMGSWPFVMITSPSDKLLMIDGSQIVKGTVDIRAKIWDDKGVASATMQIDGGQAVPLARIGDTQMWSARFDSTKVSDGDHKITVNVTGAGGNANEDTITVTVNQSGSVPQAQRSFGPLGNSIGAYAEKGLLGTHTTKSGKGGKGGQPGAKGGKKGGPEKHKEPKGIQESTE